MPFIPKIKEKYFSNYPIDNELIEAQKDEKTFFKDKKDVKLIFF